MLMLNMNIGRILLYDSLPSYITSRDLIQLLSLLCYTLPYLVEFCNLPASKPNLQPDPRKLSLSIVANYKGRTLDCDIFCLKLFEYLVTRVDIWGVYTKLEC